MRNLQKILALVLAMLMSFSLIATAGAADFPDAADITDAYQDAVKVLNGLKVFQGYKEDGTFRPKGNITRAEVAAIIYRIATGDVEDTQNSIYSTYGQFTDVADGSWYSGYVNYCANAGYIKGRGNKIFDPNSTVTGYEALAMILRAVGYDKNGEFTGSNWQIRTASIAREKDITKNVTSGQLGQAASRETVAEILFRSIMIPKVNFNANTLSYTEKGAKETLGYESLKLEEITGIVTANEFADLEDDETLADGRTRLNVNGTNYTLNYTSTLDDIGESRTAYIKNGNVSEVFVLSDSGDNVIYDDGKKIDVDDAAKEKGLKVDSTTEYFVNYDPDVEYEADWRIEYVYRMADTSLAAAKELRDSDTTRGSGINANGKLYRVDANGNRIETPVITESIGTADYNDIGVFEYVKVIKAETKLSETDKSCIRTIFRQADYTNSGYIDGEVYVGTTSIIKVDDISDDISYKEFLDTYITIIENDTFDSNTLGNRLKVIDNDDDGIAEYVLKTIYTVTKVSSVASDGKFTLMTKNINLGSPDDVNMIDNDTKMVKFNSGDELKAEDVVLYAVIDGKAQTWLAQTESAKIDKIDRVGKKVTTTDSTEYADSSVNVRPKNNGSVVIGLDDDVTRMAGSTTYSLYFDLYGNLAAFNEANEAFVLLADGWYNRVKGGDEYAVRAWMDGKLQTVDVTANGDLFIYNDDNSGQNNSWDQLRALGGVNNNMLNADNIDRNPGSNDIRTTVAMLSSDGVLTPVDMAYRTLKQSCMIALDGDLVPDQNYTAGSIYTTQATTSLSRRTAYNTAGAVNVDVRALSTTKYYFVYHAYSGGDVNDRTMLSTIVREYTGYQNLPETDYEQYIEDVYAVGTRATSATNKDYYTADVVVVELSDRYYNSLGGEQVFIPHFPVVGTNVTREEVDLIRQTGVRETVTIDLSRSDIRYYDEADSLNNRRMTGGLYYMWESSSNSGIYYVKAMTPSEIAASDRYYVGMVNYSTSGNGTGTAPSDYVVLDTYGRDQDIDGNFFPVGSNSARNVTSSSYYTLKYNSSLEATLSNSSRQEALTQRPEADRDRADYCSSRADSVYNEWKDFNAQLNEVLVAYNRVNGIEEITYAISFNEYESYDGSREGEHVHDYAQTVWFNSMPLDTVEAAVKAAVAQADAAIETNNLDALQNALAALNNVKTLDGLKPEQAGRIDSAIANVQAAIDNLNADAGWETVKTACENAINSLNKEDLKAALELLNNLSDADKAAHKEEFDSLMGRVTLAYVDAVTGDPAVTLADLQDAQDKLDALTPEQVTDEERGTAQEKIDQKRDELSGTPKYNAAEDAYRDAMNAPAEPADEKTALLTAAQTAIEAALAAAGDGSETLTPEQITNLNNWLEEVKNALNTPSSTVTFKRLGRLLATGEATDETARIIAQDIEVVDGTATISANNLKVALNANWIVMTVTGDDGEIGRPSTTEDDKWVISGIKEGDTEVILTVVFARTLDEAAGGGFIPTGRSADRRARAGENTTRGMFYTWLLEGETPVSYELGMSSEGLVDQVSITEGYPVPGGRKDGLVLWCLPIIVDSSVTSENFNEKVDIRINARTGDSVEVTWTVKDETGAEVDGADVTFNPQLPEDGKVEVGTQLTFTVAPKTGYEVTGVTVNGTAVTADETTGAYTYTVGEYDAQAAIEVTTKTSAVESKLTVDAVSTSETLLRKRVRDIQENIEVTPAADGKTFNVTGLSKYVKDWDDWSSGASGYFVALAITHSEVGLEGIEIISSDGKSSTTLKDDPYLVWKITPTEENKGNSIRVKVGREIFTIDLSGVELGYEEDYLTVEAVDPTETMLNGSNQALEKKASDLQSDITVSELVNGGTYKVSGTLKYNPMDNNATNWNSFWGTGYQEGYYIALKLTHPDANNEGDIKFISVDGNLPLPPSESNKWKNLDTDGILLWYVTPDLTGHPNKNITVGVAGKFYTIDLSAVNVGGSSGLDVIGVEDTNALGQDVKLYGKKPSDLQTNIQASAPDETGVIKVTGTSKFVSDYSNAFGSGDKMGWFIALDMEHVGVKPEEIEIWYSTEVPGSSSGHKLTADDSGENKTCPAGVLVWKINPELYSKGRYIEVEAAGRRYTIDLNGVELQDPTGELQITPVTADFGSSGSEKIKKYQSGVKVDENLRVTGTLHWQTGNSLYSGELENGFFVALNVSYEGINVTDIKIHSKLLDSQNIPGGKNLDADGIVVGRVAGYENGAIVWNTLTIDVAGKMYEVDLSGLTLGASDVQVTPASGDLGDSFKKSVEDLQSGINISGPDENNVITVTGTSFLTQGWVEFDGSSTERQNGYYVVLDLNIPDAADDAEILFKSVDGNKKGPDGSNVYKAATNGDTLIWRMSGPTGQNNNITMWVDGIKYTIDLSGVVQSRAGTVSAQSLEAGIEGYSMEYSDEYENGYVEETEDFGVVID